MLLRSLYLFEAVIRGEVGEGRGGVWKGNSKKRERENSDHGETKRYGVQGVSISDRNRDSAS